MKPGAVIKAGKKQLKYLGIISSNDNKEVKYEISNQVQQVSTNGSVVDPSVDTIKWFQKKKRSNRNNEHENEGAAIFLYEDKETGISQKIAFNIRNYWGAGNAAVAHDGHYELAVNGTNVTQRSYPYSKINEKKMTLR